MYFQQLHLLITITIKSVIMLFFNYAHADVHYTQNAVILYHNETFF